MCLKWECEINSDGHNYKWQNSCTEWVFGAHKKLFSHFFQKFCRIKWNCVGSSDICLNREFEIFNIFAMQKLSTIIPRPSGVEICWNRFPVSLRLVVADFLTSKFSFRMTQRRFPRDILNVIKYQFTHLKYFKLYAWKDSIRSWIRNWHFMLAFMLFVQYLKYRHSMYPVQTRSNMLKRSNAIHTKQHNNWHQINRKSVFKLIFHLIYQILLKYGFRIDWDILQMHNHCV